MIVLAASSCKTDCQTQSPERAKHGIKARQSFEDQEINGESKPMIKNTPGIGGKVGVLCKQTEFSYCAINS